MTTTAKIVAGTIALIAAMLILAGVIETYRIGGETAEASVPALETSTGDDWEHSSAWDPFQGTIRVSEVASDDLTLMVLQWNDDPVEIRMIHRSLHSCTRRNTRRIPFEYVVDGGPRTGATWQKSEIRSLHFISPHGYREVNKWISMLTRHDEIWFDISCDEPMIRRFGIAGTPDFGDAEIKGAHPGLRAVQALSEREARIVDAKRKRTIYGNSDGGFYPIPEFLDRAEVQARKAKIEQEKERLERERRIRQITQEIALKAIANIKECWKDHSSILASTNRIDGVSVRLRMRIASTGTVFPSALGSTDDMGAHREDIMSAIQASIWGKSGSSCYWHGIRVGKGGAEAVRRSKGKYIAAEMLFLPKDGIELVKVE